MPVEITGEIASPRNFGRIIAQNGRRSVAQRLRRQGERAAALQIAYSTELGPSRRGKRRRDGTSYRSSFDQPLYTGLDDFATGIMQITLKNRSKHAAIIEGGSRAHSIDPHGNYPLRWPPNNVSGKPTVVAWHVDHPGTRAHHILKRAATDAMRQGFVGQTIGHARISITHGP